MFEEMLARRRELASEDPADVYAKQRRTWRRATAAIDEAEQESPDGAVSAGLMSTRNAVAALLGDCNGAR